MFDHMAIGVIYGQCVQLNFIVNFLTENYGSLHWLQNFLLNI